MVTAPTPPQSRRHSNAGDELVEVATSRPTNDDQAEAEQQSSASMGHAVTEGVTVNDSPSAQERSNAEASESDICADGTGRETLEIDGNETSSGSRGGEMHKSTREHPSAHLLDVGPENPGGAIAILVLGFLIFPIWFAQ